jgi:hypothetical protein
LVNGSAPQVLGDDGLAVGVEIGDSLSLPGAVFLARKAGAGWWNTLVPNDIREETTSEGSVRESSQEEDEVLGDGPEGTDDVSNRESRLFRCGDHEVQRDSRDRPDRDSLS